MKTAKNNPNSVFLISMSPKGFLTTFADRETRLAFKTNGYEERLSGLGNSFSSASAWYVCLLDFPNTFCRFVVAVSMERLMAICMPLRARYFWGKWKLRLFMFSGESILV